MKYLLALLFSILLLSCSTEPTSQKKVKVHTYHVQNSDDGTWLFYYIIFCNNNTAYYTYSCPTPVSSFSSVPFQYSTVKPFTNEQKIEELETEEIAENDLPAEITEGENELTEETVETTEESNSDNVEDAGDNDSNDSGDSGSSDDGGSSDSGGDSGGGDGGGGGE